MLATLLPNEIGARVRTPRNRRLERKIEAFNFLPTRVEPHAITFVRMAPNHVVLIGADEARREPVTPAELAQIRILDEGQAARGRF